MRADQKTLGRSRSAGQEEKLVNLSINIGECRRQGRGCKKIRGWNPILPLIYSRHLVYCTHYTVYKRSLPVFAHAVTRRFLIRITWTCLH